MSRVTDHDVLYGYRLQLFDLAARTSVTHACATFGVHRSTYYRWKRQVDRHGLGMLRPKERRRPRMPNQLSALVEERIVAYSLGHPGQGPDRISAELRRLRPVRDASRIETVAVIQLGNASVGVGQFAGIRLAQTALGR